MGPGMFPVPPKYPAYVVSVTVWWTHGDPVFRRFERISSVSFPSYLAVPSKGEKKAAIDEQGKAPW